LKGYSKCSTCTKRNNSKYNGNFSPEEFDALETQKVHLHQEAQAKRKEIGELAVVTAAAYTALAKAQQEEIDITSRIDRFTETQSRMLRQELSALDSLNEASDQEVAVSDFLWDELIQDSAD
jgi:hypothetical protein